MLVWFLLGRCGSVSFIVICVFLLGMLCIFSWLCMSVISCWQMFSLRLVLLYLWLVFILVCVNGLNSCLCCLVEMLILVLVMIRCNCCVLFRFFIQFSVMVICFCLVNLMVLLSRLNVIWCRCMLLVRCSVVIVLFIWSDNCSFLVEVCGVSSCCILFSSDGSVIGCGFSGSVFVLMCEYIRMLLRICCSICVEFLIILIILCCLVFSCVCESIFSMFSMLFIGVCILWFIVVRKFVLVVVVCLVVVLVLVKVLVCVWVLVIFIQYLFYSIVLFLVVYGSVWVWIQCSMLCGQVWNFIFSLVKLSVVCFSICSMCGWFCVLSWVIIWFLLVIVLVVFRLNIVFMLFMMQGSDRCLLVLWWVWQIMVGRLLVILVSCCFICWCVVILWCRCRQFQLCISSVVSRISVIGIVQCIVLCQLMLLWYLVDSQLLWMVLCLCGVMFISMWLNVVVSGVYWCLIVSEN